MRDPCALEAGEVGIVTGRGAGDEVAGSPEAEPVTLAPDDVDECALKRDEAGAEVLFALFGGEGGRGFEEALVGLAVVVGLELELVGSHGFMPMIWDGPIATELGGNCVSTEAASLAERNPGTMLPCD